MCGIAGRFETANMCSSNLESIHDMTATLVHRGPDRGDVWTDKPSGIALGHRRLAIIDLSEAGHQPMHSSCGRVVISYNGEVYNAAELRQELMAAGRSFRGHSDTEVIVEGCAHWGIEATVERLIGMFAFGLWDRKERALTIVRDRLGIKPLYWSQKNGVVLFASELKALKAAPEFDSTIDRNAVVSFLRHNYIPAPLTIYKSAQKLEPGWMMTVQAGSAPKLKPYWRLEDIAKTRHENPIGGSDEEAIDALEAVLSDAVARRMISDVPLGAFLSGGIDSSTVVALMQKASASPVKTFSIGFDVDGYNEAPHAAAVAKHLGTDHTELYVSPSQAMDVIPMLASMYDEPFADSSQIPTYLVSALTRQHVTVSLSGDGGDELFSGYNRYIQAETLMRRIWRLPTPVRRLAAEMLTAVPIQTWNAIMSRLPVLSRYPLAGDKVHKLASVLSEDRNGFYRRLVTHWDDPETLVPGGREQVHPIWEHSKSTVPEFVDRMQFIDTMTYLPDDILTKVDRASMMVSLEARIPIIDHRVVEFAWRLPRHFKIRNGVSKWILRQLLYRYVPQELVDRPKTGFGIPIDHWLRGPLRGWAEDLLSESALNTYGLIDPAPVQEKWREHLNGQRNWQYLLWDVLMLQSWCEKWA